MCGCNYTGAESGSAVAQSVWSLCGRLLVRPSAVGHFRHSGEDRGRQHRKLWRSLMVEMSAGGTDYNPWLVIYSDDSSKCEKMYQTSAPILNSDSISGS